MKTFKNPRFSDFLLKNTDFLRDFIPPVYLSLNKEKEFTASSKTIKF